MLHQQMSDKEYALIMFSFFINPKFLLRYVWVPVVLAKICELLINMTTDLCTIDNPSLEFTAGFVPLYIG
jgi:ABC-type transport system involved in cytochrome c biogenesis permease subunit